MTDQPAPTAPRQGDCVRIEWDRIPGPDCITLNGQPFSVSRAKIEWPGGKGMPRPILTLEQTLFAPFRHGDLVEDMTRAAVVSEGYLVSKADWEAFQAWLLTERRAAREATS